MARLEKEAQSLKRVSEEVFRVQKQIDGEKLERESASGQLQSDLQQLLSKLPAPLARRFPKTEMPDDRLPIAMNRPSCELHCTSCCSLAYAPFGKTLPPPHLPLHIEASLALA